MKLVTNNFRYSSAKHFIDSVSESNTTYYAFAGRSQPFANDNNVPTLYDNTQDIVYDVYDNMLFGKRVTSSDVCLMIRRYDWTSNTVYSRYDNEDSTLSDKQYYVINSNNAVFKCLNNNNGSPSLIEPTVEDPTDESYITSDGYQWKYMYSASQSTVAKFATAEYFPVVENTNVSGNAVAGAVEVIDLVTPSDRRYLGVAQGTFQDVEVAGNTVIYVLAANSSSSNDVYTGGALYISSGGANEGYQRRIIDYDAGSKRIQIETPFPFASNTLSQYTISPNVIVGGNGIDAQARAVVNSSTQTVQGIIVTNRGAGYDYVSVEVEGIVATNTPAAPVLRAILPPSGGHGKNQAQELGARWVGISANFVSSLSNGKVVDENDYRIIGLIKNPKYRQVRLTVAPEHSVSSFAVGQTITQSTTYASAIIDDIDTSNNTLIVTNAVGLFDVSLAGQVQQLVITSPGSGYFGNTTVTISGNTGSGATANAQANSLGNISVLNLTATGVGYLTAPTVTIAPPSFTFNANTDVNPLSVKTFNALNDVSNTNNTIAISSNPFVNGDIVTYIVSGGNTAVGGLSNGEIYYVVAANSTVLCLANTVSGANIDITAGSNETGHTLTNISRVEDYITVSSNKFQLGDKLQYVANTGNTAVSGLTSGSYYYVRFANTTAVKLSNTTGYPVKLVKGASETGHNLIGETATGIAVISSNVINVITNGSTNAVVNAVSGQETYFDQTLRLEVINKDNSIYFEEDETVIQPGRTGIDAANGLFYASSNTANGATGVTFRLTNTRGTFNTSGDGTEYLVRGTEAPVGNQPQANIQNQTFPDFVYGSGDVIYIESVPPITKNSSQTETFKFIFEF